MKNPALVSALLLTYLFTPRNIAAAEPGDPDTSFDRDGSAVTAFGCDAGAHAMALQSDGKIVTAGQFADCTGPTQFALTRYRPNGRLDASFGGDGRVVTEFGGEYGTIAIAQAVAVQPDGYIVAAGSVQKYPEFLVEDGSEPRTGFALVRYRPDGDLDASFGEGGIVVTDRLSQGGIYGLALQPDGKIVVAGAATDGSASGWAVARYRTNGTLDRSFGDDGVVITDFGGSIGHAFAIALQPDGKIVVAGRASPVFGQLEFGVARYQANGRMDRTFGVEGRVTTQVGDNYHATSLALQSDGKIVVGGYYFSALSDLALVRFRADGALDSDFDGDGQVLLDLGHTELIYGIAVQPDGKIVAAGRFGDASTYETSFVVARFETDGSLDAGFSGDGLVTADPSGHGFATAEAVVVQPDGKIVAAGSTRNSEGGGSFAVVRFHGN